MKNELRLDKAGARVRAPVETQTWIPIVIESAQAMAAHRHKCEHHDAGEGGHSLLYLYNQLFDFVKKSGDRYTPVEWPHEATHRLKATAWNEAVRLDDRFLATAVCAVPIVRKHKRSNIKVTREFPEEAEVYKLEASTPAKRALLRVYVQAMRARVKLRTLDKLTNEECDMLYRSLRRASIQFLLR